jgi:hypothetical protein
MTTSDLMYFVFSWDPIDFVFSWDVIGFVSSCPPVVTPIAVDSDRIHGNFPQPLRNSPPRILDSPPQIP